MKTVLPHLGLLVVSLGAIVIAAPAPASDRDTRSIPPFVSSTQNAASDPVAELVKLLQTSGLLSSLQENLEPASGGFLSSLGSGGLLSSLGSSDSTGGFLSSLGSGGLFSSLGSSESSGGFLSNLFGSSAPKATHELVSVEDFPVWQVHHYQGLDLKPVPMPSKPYPDANSHISTEFSPPIEPASDVYGDDTSSSLGILEQLPVLNALSGLQSALSSIRQRISQLPQTILNAIGIGNSEESIPYNSEGVLPTLSQLSSSLPQIPGLPSLIPHVLSTQKKIPLYVRISKPTPEKSLDEVPADYVPVEGSVIYKTPSKDYKTYDAPLGMLPPMNYPEQQYPSKEYDSPAKPEYEAPRKPQSEYGVPNNKKHHLDLGQFTDLNSLAGAAEALSQFNSIGEAIEALNSLNAINDLTSIGVNEPGFEPSNGIGRSDTVSPVPLKKAVPVNPISVPVIPSQHGHVAASAPARSSPPAFRGSQPDPVNTESKVKST